MVAAIAVLLVTLSAPPAAALTPDQLLGKIFPHADRQHPKRSRMKQPPAAAKPPLPAPKPGSADPASAPAPAAAEKPAEPPLPSPSPATVPAEPAPPPPVDTKPPLPEPAPPPEAATPLDGALDATVPPTAPLGAPAPPAGTVIAPTDALGPVIPPVQPAPLPEFAPAAPMPKPAAKPDEPPEAATAPPRQLPTAEELASCKAGMAGLAITAKAEPPVVEGECGAPDPFTVSALEDGAVTLAPAATIDCAMASALAIWIADDVQPAVKAAFGTKASTIDVAGSYACRGRNNVEGARLSEHAFANAIDIAGFTIGDRTVTVAAGNGQSAADAAFIETIRLAACRRFTTVLGPGSDVEHASHLHLDAIKRGRNGDYRICE